MEKIICKKCHTEKTFYGKAIITMKDGKQTFHYYVECPRSHRSYLPRTKEIFDLVKNQNWTLSRKEQLKIVKKLKKEKQLSLL